MPERTPTTDGAPPRTAYTLREVATSTGLSLRQVQRLVAAGDLPSGLLGGRRVVPAADFWTFVDSIKKAS